MATLLRQPWPAQFFCGRDFETCLSALKYREIVEPKRRHTRVEDRELGPTNEEVQEDGAPSANDKDAKLDGRKARQGCRGKKMRERKRERDLTDRRKNIKRRLTKSSSPLAQPLPGGFEFLAPLQDVPWRSLLFRWLKNLRRFRCSIGIMNEFLDLDSTLIILQGTLAVRCETRNSFICTGGWLVAATFRSPFSLHF